MALGEMDQRTASSATEMYRDSIFFRILTELKDIHSCDNSSDLAIRRVIR
jgi:hypothetical protein